MKGARRVDLVRLAAHLEAQQRHPDLVKAVARAAAAGSIREDLRTALASLRLIEQRQHDNPRDDVRVLNDETTITGALFTQAVILYARATFTTGNRPSLLGEAGLSPDERATHDEVKRLRNGAIGHFGRGEELQDGALVREAVILSFTRQQRQLGVYTVRAQHRAGLSARLIHLIEVRLREIADRQDALFDKVDALLSAAVKGDSALGPSLPQFAFDADSFCGNPDAANRLRAQLERGEIEDMDYAVAVPKP
ncbi:MAG: hypothetical protein RLZZ444_2209 [Pseudomonadota bacterium]|jgi:hypothetical protein